ncbi:MAG: CRISPR-associated helicase Cas3', partial [Spirochaetaceae bacterium]|nr:CRISPR-associated helicase Cas3' [Spirochaetaceae bacterium]
MTRPNVGSIDILRFWGKARPGSPEGPRWHPAAFHCLDVAAVGEVLLAEHRGLGASVCRLLGLPRDQTLPLVCYLLCLHDVGKFAKKFQAKAPEFYPDCFGHDPTSFPHQYDHGAGGLRLFDADPSAFELPEGKSPRTWRPLISAVTGHHGKPPLSHGDESLTTLRSDFGRVGIEAASEFIRQARELFAPAPDLPGVERRAWRRASHAVAGLAVLADWIGSNQDWFPYREPVQDLDAYWRHARERAERAVAEAGVLPAPAGARLDHSDLLGAGATPSPMQAWAAGAALPDGPALFLIEDETGSGKTEAALMLAHRLMHSGRADGLYVALPTMATANAMFDRLSSAYRRLFATGAEPSIALAHGARDLHGGFRDAVLRGGRSETPYSGAPESDGEAETTASAACAAWIADDRRRAFLADVGAGSVDQALLSVLPGRHQSLRLLGLMRRVLVIDEVHAYDPYMQREIERLLEFQAGLGGSAILLSATLPRSTRERLADAFVKGLREESTGPDAGMDYPLATVCAADGRSATKVSGQAGRGRVLPVRFLRSPDAAIEKVERAAGAGKAVLYIRNTVDDAFDACAALEARGLTPGVFHARFAFADRLEIERKVAKMFGKRSTASMRAGQVLIATQVVEQSLDLDFDVLVTDLAPIDLLIQRAGRLWRHDGEERNREGQPELLVVGPEAVADPGDDWFRRAFPRAAYVYKDHA